MSTRTIAELDQREVLRILSEITEELREDLSASERSAIKDPEEARAALAAFLAQEGLAAGAAGDIPAAELLDLLLRDPDTGETTRTVVQSPPADSQKSPELAAEAAIILGSLITWLQTSVEISVARKSGKTEFHFKLKKESTAKKTLSDVARTVSGLIP